MIPFSPVLQMLNTLLSEDMLPVEKKQILQDDFDISMTDTLDEGVEPMCNYSQYVEDKGIEKGIEKGVEKGILTAIQTLMETMKWSAEEAMAALKIPAVDQPKYAEKLPKLNS